MAKRGWPIPALSAGDRYPALTSQAKEEMKMTTVCCVCYSIISGQGGPVSHGAHVHCLMLIYPDYQRSALMMPKADRFKDCPKCHYRDLDSDGIPDGCMAPNGICIAPGKRSPWKY